MAQSQCGKNRTLPFDLAGICPLAGPKCPLGGLKSPLGGLKVCRADIVDDEGEATTAPGTSAMPGNGVNVLIGPAEECMDHFRISSGSVEEYIDKRKGPVEECMGHFRSSSGPVEECI